MAHVCQPPPNNVKNMTLFPLMEMQGHPKSEEMYNGNHKLEQEYIAPGVSVCGEMPPKQLEVIDIRISRCVLEA